jgi:hypothetical protein
MGLSSNDTRLKTTPAGFLFFIVSFLIVPLIIAWLGVAQATAMDLTFGKDGLSATLEASSLKTVIERIAEKEAIWIKGAENLSDHTYSGEFVDVGIHEAVVRMLEPFNCCYFYDGEGDLVGIIIVSKKDGRGLAPRGPVPRHSQRPGLRR